MNHFPAERHPQALQCLGVAGPPPPLDFPFQPDIKLLAERHRRVLCQAYPPKTETRRLPIRERPENRNRPLHRTAQRRRSQTLQMARQPRRNHRRQKSGVPIVGINPLDWQAVCNRSAGLAPGIRRSKKSDSLSLQIKTMTATIASPIPHVCQSVQTAASISAAPISRLPLGCT